MYTIQSHGPLGQYCILRAPPFFDKASTLGLMPLQRDRIPGLTGVVHRIRSRCNLGGLGFRVQGLG